MGNQIKATRSFSFGLNKDENYIPESNTEIIESIMKIPAVSVRGHKDELIEYDVDAPEPILRWRKEALMTFDTQSLRMLRVFAEKRCELQTKRW